MKRRLVTGWIRALAIAGPLALALWGCGKMPLNAPVLSSGTSALDAGPQFLTTPPDGSTGFVSASRVSVSEAATLSPTSLTASASVSGILGGRVACGRFLVTVPPGAYAGVGTITMKIADSTVAVVDLSISPIGYNSFKQAVKLSYNATGLTLSGPLTIYWYDSSRKRWVALTVNIDPVTGLPTAYLKHFSKYGAGKAGW